ncbi:hypothetical protein FACS1894166_02830 [Bacilli bacterium]|nr:hypothetical protein FACS1894166_02830 [Bacilli bacterium]
MKNKNYTNFSKRNDTFDFEELKESFNDTNSQPLDKELVEICKQLSKD